MPLSHIAPKTGLHPYHPYNCGLVPASYCTWTRPSLQFRVFRIMLCSSTTNLFSVIRITSMGLCYFWECSSSCSSIWTWPQENLTSEGWMALTLCPNAPNKNHMSVPLRMNSQNSGLGLRGSWGEMGFTQTANLSRGMCWIIRVSSSDFLTDVGDWTTMLVSVWVCACVFSSALSFLRL